MKLRIVCVPADLTVFNAQKELVKSTGANYDAKNRVWWHDTEHMKPGQLEKLFDAVRQYGTQINVE